MLQKLQRLIHTIKKMARTNLSNRFGA